MRGNLIIFEINKISHDSLSNLLSKKIGNPFLKPHFLGKSNRILPYCPTPVKANSLAGYLRGAHCPT